ncbi:hypothetical protein ERJ75_001303800 [Trypanosoma vivax]|nr:hypothetical protein ERJ75_001303800 [Trypanosoma vivax]
MSRVGTVSRRHQLCYAVSLLPVWPCAGTANNVPPPRLRVRVARPRSLTSGESTRGVGAAATTRSERLQRRAGSERGGRCFAAIACGRTAGAMEPREVSWRAEVFAAQRHNAGRREGNGVEQSREGENEAFLDEPFGFASLLALLSANKAQGHAAKGVKRSSAQGACSFATALDAVASAAELAATEAAERSANASAWQEALATALSKTNNATAVDALGTAAALQSKRTGRRGRVAPGSRGSSVGSRHTQRRLRLLSTLGWRE